MEPRITLRPVTGDNLRALIRLSETLTEPQSHCVAPNAVSVAQAHVSDAAWMRAISLGDERRVEECRITQRKGDDVLAYDLKVCATPFDRDGERFVIFAINDNTLTALLNPPHLSS